ncbi:P-loop containing nucleoside triphosphate hydrolase protein [Chaetomium strumarium]|uniref:P-loop containing nucleoside triphosphate hydrolase protein n=1 Tax=Chaetomium strumarium TaxID=1170767 RepID=A0AAJ0M6Q4_9PEZI|nr:P-loop containing nucleoside triphosphate hydrolase protein [Chaetomium strumarium]
MLPTELSRYVAAGCLILEKTELEDQLAGNIWSHVKPGEWHHFLPLTALDKNEGFDGQIGYVSQDEVGESTSQSLTPEIQSRLFSSSGPLGWIFGLLLNRWIHMNLGISSNTPDLAIVRVYLLPDDVDNRSIPRFADDLRRARTTLLQHLDLSKKTWQGQVSEAEEEQHGESRSLLQMFNSIPSPDPRPGDILDFEVRDAAFRLMDSDVPGLITTLYSYQRRSAALMLQRESQTMQMVDPRLTMVADQLGSQWYYDAVSGTILREPVHYDEPRGGILAEEMGAGKTLICLALILASRHIPSATPDHLRMDEPVVRPRIGSLADMAAACVTRNSVPWRSVLGGLAPEENEYRGSLDAIRRNPGFYLLPPPTRHRRTRQPDSLAQPRRVLLSHTSLLIVPPNLVQQWKQEISKHTTGLRVFIIVDKKQELLPAQELTEYDILLFTSTRFERLIEYFAPNPNGVHVLPDSPLARLAMIHFKRCIVDEGHKLGNSRSRRRSNIHLIIDYLQISAKWVVTGTPSKGLFGVDDTNLSQPDSQQQLAGMRQTETSADLEMEDLQRIGSIARFFLQMRPWANKSTEPGDTPADWSVYVMQPRHSARSAGSEECLRATLGSLIIRHRLSELSDLLPTVDEKVVYLDGSFQDRLVLNLFSMMIIFNAVQSQRTDQDYFFHPRQRKALVELVLNLRQASFFGGSFFSAAEIRRAIDTAEDFLREGKVPISSEDEALLRDAIEFGHVAVENSLKNCANRFREVPLYIHNFPWGAGREWSLDLKDGDPVCTDSRLISALQKFVHPLVDAPTSLQMMFDSGRFAERGSQERLKGLEEQDPDGEGTQKPQQKTLAGNTQLGQDSTSPNKRRSAILARDLAAPGGTLVAAEAEQTTIAAALSGAQLVSTASAKLSYLIDQIVKYQDSEQIIIFYENDNVAYYLAGVLEILQIQHLIYAKTLTPERRAQYVATFNHNPKFRVLLMDVGQAAFGLDMQSASRIYFINPVLNPQVVAQAIGRARRISQKKPVSVETLVLRGTVEEVIVKRRGEMTQAEQWRCRSILDDKPIYEWILNAKILPLPGGKDIAPPDQMAKLQSPQFLFGRGFGRELSHSDQDLLTVNGSPVGKKKSYAVIAEKSLKRASPEVGFATSSVGTPLSNDGPARKRRPQVRFFDEESEEHGSSAFDQHGRVYPRP